MKHSHKVSKSDLQAVKIQIELRIKLLNFFNGSQWGSHFALSFAMGHYLFFMHGINSDFGNRSQFDPLSCTDLLFVMCVSEAATQCRESNWDLFPKSVFIQKE